MASLLVTGRFDSARFYASAMHEYAHIHGHLLMLSSFRKDADAAEVLARALCCAAMADRQAMYLMRSTYTPLLFVDVGT